MPEFLSIGIPARNEAQSIERTIHSITKSKAWREAAPADRELIVCVNGSRDKTAQVARALASGIPGMKVIELKKPGKNNAINHIAQESSSRADIIYFSDADVLVKRDTIGKTNRALRADRKMEFAAPIVVPSAAFVHPNRRGPTSSLYAEVSRIARRDKLYRLTGQGFAVRKKFLIANPMPTKKSFGDDRFINYAYSDKIKVVYDAVVVSRVASARDHMLQRVRHKRQKRNITEARLDLRETAKAQTKELKSVRLRFLKEIYKLSPRARWGLVVNQVAELWASVKSRKKTKEVWPTIKSTKIKKRRRK